MGYHTDFSGELQLSRPATKKEIKYINKFSSCRRMGRDVNKLMEKFNGKKGYPKVHLSDEDKTNPEKLYGREGEYFVGDESTAVIDNNKPPGAMGWGHPNYSFEKSQEQIKKDEAQPGLWCQWILDDDGKELLWDGGEKFYEYTAWLKYMVKHFFEPWGIRLNGEIHWDGEDSSDIGKIVVIDNVVEEKAGRIVYD